MGELCFCRGISCHHAGRRNTCEPNVSKNSKSSWCKRWRVDPREMPWSHAWLNSSRMRRMCSTASSLSRSCFASGRVTCHVKPRRGRGGAPRPCAGGLHLTLNRLTDLSSKFAAQCTLVFSVLAPAASSTPMVLVLSIWAEAKAQTYSAIVLRLFVLLAFRRPWSGYGQTPEIQLPPWSASRSRRRCRSWPRSSTFHAPVRKRGNDAV